MFLRLLVNSNRTYPMVAVEWGQLAEHEYFYSFELSSFLY